MTSRTPRRLAAFAAAVPLVLTLTAVGASAAPGGEPGPASHSADGAKDKGHDKGHGKGHGKGKHHHKAQPELETRSKDILKVKGREFRDLNDNGKVDRYEDWRRPVEQRTADLVERMTLEEKAGLMLIDTFNALCGGDVDQAVAADYIGTQQMHRFVFRNSVVRPENVTCVDGSTGRGSSSVTPTEAATFTNSIQELSEATRLGIPALFKSNARNHIDPDARFGINESAGQMSAFPKEAGIAAAALGAQASAGQQPTDGDMSVVEDFADVMGEEWSAIGLRGMYGYMADLSTEPRWYRTHETFTEDADLMSNIASSLVGTLQGPVDENGDSLTPDSDVALTMKHFPGGGPQELGFDPHYSFGKTQVYPGDGFGYNLQPFEAAIDAGVSSIMPYYGAPMDVTHEGRTFPEVGFAFSDDIVNGLLRDDLGFRGYVNSDTGIINDRAWGLEDATVPERVAAAVNGGTDTLSGFHDASVILDLVGDGLVTEERVDLAATRLLTPLFQMGLFENPYVDAEAADDIVGSDANQAVGKQTQRDSLVLLENKLAEDGKGVLPLREGATVYTLGGFDSSELGERGFTVIDGDTENPADRPSAEGADVVLVHLSALAGEAAQAYRSNDPATGLNPDHINPIVMPGVEGLDGQSPYGAADACVAQGAPACTDDGLRFGGVLPWEVSTLDFTGMSNSESWEVTPTVDVIQQVMAEVGDPRKVVLDVYFRQPFVLDEASGLRDAGAIVADFGVRDETLLDVLTGEQDFRGRMPFALAGTPEAILEQYSDLPGYEETADGALYEYGHGLSYEDEPSTGGPGGPGGSDGDIPVTAVIPGTDGQPGIPGGGGPGNGDGEPAPGALALTVADGGLNLADARNAGDRLRLSGTLPQVTVTDSRADAAGWSVTGQSGDLTSDASVVTAEHLGWSPFLVEGDAVPGARVRTVLDGAPGLATPATLGSSGGGVGSSALAADVTLEAPVSTRAGTYTGGVTVSLFPQD